MKIQQVTVENFRSISKTTIDPSNFNIFVGQNNHGKTNFFEAIKWFFTGKGPLSEIRRRGKTDPILVDIIYSEANSGLEAMANPTAKTKLTPYVNNEDQMRVRRTTDDDATKKFEIFNPATAIWEKLPSGMDNSLLDLLPTFEYVETKTHLKDIAKFGAKDTPMNSMLSGVLNAILSDDPNYREFKDKFDELFSAEDSQVKVELDLVSKSVKGYLVKQFPECTEVEFSVKEPLFEDLLKNFETRVDDGVMTDATEKGDGMQRAIMLAIIQAYADFRKNKEGAVKNFSFFIDEGELHLHPTAQRKLKEALRFLSDRGDQIFLNTHSAVLLADDQEGQHIYTVNKEQGISNIKLVASEDKKYVVYDLLGGSPSDLLLPRNFLIVEGESEFVFLKQIIDRFYGYKNIQIIKAMGDIDQARRSINAIEKLYTPLSTSLYKDTLVVLLDQPSSTKITQGSLDIFLSTYSNLRIDEHIFLLPVDSLEEYYPDAEDGQIEANNDVPKWKRTAIESSAMISKQKVKLAEVVGSKITQVQFESTMSKVHAALLKCEEKAFA